MPQYIQEDVADIRANPTRGAVETLIIRVADGEKTAFKEEIEENYGGSVVEDLPFGYVLASVEHEAIDELCDHPAVESVEIEGESVVLSAGN